MDYVRAVKPILAARCFACHGALQQKSGLRLDTVALMKKGGDGGPVIVPGKSGQSLNTLARKRRHSLSALRSSLNILIPTKWFRLP